MYSSTFPRLGSLGPLSTKSLALNMLCSAITSSLFAQLLMGDHAFSVASAFESSQALLHASDHDTIDIVTGSEFNGLTTFGNLPYSNCFIKRGESFDIAILGAPFDTVRALLILSFASRSGTLV